jgi:serine/threonine-protein kinase
LLASFGDSKDPAICERIAKACLLLPWDSYETQQAAALADRAEAAQRGHDSSNPYDVFAHGLAAYRLHRYDDVITLMSGKAANITSPCPKLIIAMALHQKGQYDKAMKTLSEAIAAFDWNQRPPSDRAAEFWVAQIVRRQAESLIRTQPPKSASSAPANAAPAVGR